MQNKELVIIETEKGNFTIELFPEAAPGTVENFIKLINAKFYDGLTFHRCLPNFVIQGGCPDGSGRSGPGYQIKCETAGNPHKHLRGSLSMAHAGKDTGGSQFFIVRQPQPHLDGKHTVFGQVVDNVDLVDAIEQNDRMLCVRMVAAADSSNTPQE
ncbi:MAG: peptidylprolyl isomerase [Peptococcaceae bacterium]|nr:peptidylprolyl isomerase [Peptococcaceae bacterium]